VAKNIIIICLIIALLASIGGLYFDGLELSKAKSLSKELSKQLGTASGIIDNLNRSIKSIRQTGIRLTEYNQASQRDEFEIERILDSAIHK
jgi:hypothetical protein